MNMKWGFVEIVLVALRAFVVVGGSWVEVSFVVDEKGVGTRAWGRLKWVGREV